MILSDISVRRPVFATVLSLLLVAFGVLSFVGLPLRELPNIDPPVVSISTTYPGASADVVQSRITEVLEDQVSGIEGIDTITSRSRDGGSDITIEFTLSRDIEAAANDVRDAVSRVIDRLPAEVDAPQVAKADADADPVMWLNFSAAGLDPMALTEFARKTIVDRLSIVDGVAQVRVGGGQAYAIRIWIDRQALAARAMTVADIEAALRTQNVELPAGAVQSLDRTLTVRLKREFTSEEEFRNLVLKRGENGYLVRLGEVAKIELGAEDARRLFRGNGVPMVGLGIGPGDEVIVPGFTFVASISSIAFTGAVPVLAEVDRTLNLDPADVRQKITPRTKAIFIESIANPGGTITDIEAIAAVARKAGVPFLGVWLDLPAEALKARVTARRGGPSDATAETVDHQLGYDLGDITWTRLDSGRDRAELVAGLRPLL